MTPKGKLSSTGHALATAESASAEILVYAPSGGPFSVNLSNWSGRLTAEWFDPATGTTICDRDSTRRNSARTVAERLEKAQWAGGGVDEERIRRSGGGNAVEVDDLGLTCLPRSASHVEEALALHLQVTITVGP
jgi:hypothetical protein